MKRIPVLICAFLVSLYSRAQVVDTIWIPSKAMQQSFKCVIIHPTEFAQGKPGPLPVVYLLHGFSGNYSNWIKLMPSLAQIAQEYEMLIVCPDGGYSSWYLDSPVDSSMKYETYGGKEIPEYIDDHYNTIRDRKGRAITGLSMGGHGGLFLGFRHSETFGACGSMSGGVDLNYSRNKFDVIKRLGDTIRYADNWKKYSVINVVENKPAESLRIIFDCGTEDFFFQNNRDLHEKMLRLKIPHDYIERPGQHNWDYWRNSVKYQLYFFKNYFESN